MGYGVILLFGNQEDKVGSVLSGLAGGECKEHLLNAVLENMGIKSKYVLCLIWVLIFQERNLIAKP